MSGDFSLKKQNTQTFLEYQLRYYNHLYTGIIDIRPLVVIDQQNILHHILLLGDLFEPPANPPRILSITSLELSFLVQEWLSFMLCNYVGAYSSASRTLRWIYESTLAATMALTNPSLLLCKPTSHPLTYEAFRSWLWKYDNRAVHFPRKESLKAIGLNLKEQLRYNGLYSMLCKYSHISAKHFSIPEPIPDLVFNLEDFDVVSRYAYRTMDLAFFCIVKSIISQWRSQDVRGFFEGYFDWFDALHAFAVRRDRFPLTIKLLSTYLSP
jgi:hypothetical protein